MLWFSLIAVGLGVTLAVMAVRRSAGPRAERTAGSAGRSQPVIALKGTGACDVDIDNEGECQDALIRLCGNEFGKRQDVATVATLLTSASAAVRVEIDGLLVGRLSPDAAVEYVRQMAQLNLSGRTTSCAAVITFSDQHECYQVRLNLEWPPAPEAAPAHGGASPSP